MQSLLATAGLLLATAITPGPNNLVVLREAGRSGVRGAVAAIGGIMLGGIALLTLTIAGAGPLLVGHAVPRTALSAGGAVYMAWLGACLLGGFRNGAGSALDGTPLPAGMLGLFGFQFLNPKGWAMVLTIVATSATAGLSGYLQLVSLFTLILLACLLLWAVSGCLLGGLLTRPSSRQCIDTAMGVLLLGSALLILVELNWRTP